MTERKPGWEYIYSETLNQEIACHIKTGWVYCQDGTKYSPKEIDLLKEATIPKAVHDIKHLFDGTIIEVGERNNAKTEHKENVTEASIEVDENGEPYIF